MVDLRRPQRMVAGHVVRNGRVRASGHDDPHVVRGRTGQQRGDAVTVGTGGDAVVLVQPVHHQDEPSALRRAALRRTVHGEPQLFVPRGGRAQRLFLPQQGVQLSLDDLAERGGVVLARHTGGDEERDDVDPGRRIQDELRQQSGLSGPGGGQPAPVVLSRRFLRTFLRAEGGQFRKLGLTSPEVGRRHPLDLEQIARHRGSSRGRGKGHRAVDDPGVRESRVPLCRRVARILRPDPAAGHSSATPAGIRCSRCPRRPPRRRCR
ncbi:hypothetical protein GA0115253_110209 [Streptomyces sp. Termitarium-T10T-6]|nr:hypothetical protein GA0115253_110209 [Streptomyces sp. Termitarium-T10T-6]